MQVLRRLPLIRRKTGIRLVPVLLILVLLLSNAIPSTRVAAGGTTTISASGVTFNIGPDAGGVNKYNAQGFVVYAGRLTSFRFNLISKTGSPSTTLNWEIQTATNSLPSGSNVATGTVTATTGTNTEVTLGGSGPLLSANTLYYLVLYLTPDPAASNNYLWMGSAVSTYDWGQRVYSTDHGATWLTSASNDLDCSFTTTDDTPTPSQTFTPSETYTATATGTQTLVPSDTPTPTLSPTPSNTPVPTWTLTPTPNVAVVLTLTTGQAIQVQYVWTGGDITIGFLLMMVVCFIGIGTFIQTRRRRSI